LGRLQVLDFEVEGYDSEQTQNKLRNHIIEYLADPVGEINCKEIRQKLATDLFLVNFGERKLENLDELARLEFMMFGYDERIKIYFSNETECAKRIGVMGEVSVVLF